MERPIANRALWCLCWFIKVLPVCVLHPFRSPIPTSAWPRSPFPTPGPCHFKIYCGEESLPTGDRGEDSPVVLVAPLRAGRTHWIRLCETMREGETSHKESGTRKVGGDAWNHPPWIFPLSYRRHIPTGWGGEGGGGGGEAEEEQNEKLNGY